jgi:hypothetical protein
MNESLLTHIPPDLTSIVGEYYHSLSIYSTSYAFVAKMADGRVVTWGIKIVVETAAWCRLN